MVATAPAASSKTEEEPTQQWRDFSTTSTSNQLQTHHRQPSHVNLVQNTHGKSNYRECTIFIIYKTHKMSYYVNNKDHTPLMQQSNVIYEFSCPGCHANYIGKTERTLNERSQEHGWTNKDKPVYHHLMNCENFQYIMNIHRCNDLLENSHTSITTTDYDLDIRNFLIKRGRRWV